MGKESSRIFPLDAFLLISVGKMNANKNNDVIISAMENPYLQSVDKNHCFSALFAEFISVIEGFGQCSDDSSIFLNFSYGFPSFMMNAKRLR